METLESSHMCRLCGKHSGISINIFDKNENHIRKINAVLPIMVHEMDLLPKHMCHRCSYKLEEFHKFYIDCLRTDADLKSQLSWMRKENAQETTGVPMVQIENIKIKAEPPDYDIYELDPIVENVSYIKSMSSMTFPVNGVRRNDIHEGLAYTTYARCGCYFNKGQNRRTAGKLYAKATKDAESRNHSGASEIDAESNVATGAAQILENDLLRHDSVPQNYRENDAEHSNNVIKDARKYKSSIETKESSTFSSANGLFDRSKLASSRSAFRISKNTVVRNLRPRKGSIDYVGTKRKTLARKPDSEIRSKSADGKIRLPARPDSELVVQIKTEPCDDSERRMLRPRTKVIDYLGRKRKDPQTATEQRRSKSEEQVAKRVKSSAGDAADPWLPTMKTSKSEPVDDEFDFTLQKELLVNSSIVGVSSPGSNGSCRTKPETRLGTKDLLENVDIPSNNILIKVEDNICENPITNGGRSRSSLNFVGKLKSLKKEKSEKSGKAAAAKRKVGAHFSPKYLRSQDGHLRNGKVKKFDSNSISIRKLRKNLHHITAGSRVVSKNLFKVIKENVCAKNGSGTEKLVDIKHYCEKCNVSFANKELYKLHGCYYD